MKLATTTGDYSLYPCSQTEALVHIRGAGFRYADYNFGTDYARRDGVYGAEFEKHIDSVNETAAKTGIKLVQAHSPMGKPLEDDGTFLREANISTAGVKMVYNAKDTLYVVIGEPRAVSRMLLNGVDTPLPEMKFGRVTRFRVYDGAIVSTGAN